MDTCWDCLDECEGSYGMDADGSSCGYYVSGRYGFIGLSDYGNNSSRLYVTSARALIAFKTAKASESNARYTPPANERLDTVSISCGDSDIGEIFECSRVRVMNREKRVIKPSLMPPTFSTFHLSLKQA